MNRRRRRDETMKQGHRGRSRVVLMEAAVCVAGAVIGFGAAGYGSQSDEERLKEVVVSPVSISSAPRPVGSGARALGMGAFTAIADDATAASWNPAGLIQLERPEISGVGSYLSRSEDFVSADAGLGVDPGDMSSTDINYLSGVLPFRVFNTNFVVSLNYQQVYSFDRKLHFTYFDRSIDEMTERLPGGLSLKTAIDSETTCSPA